MRGSSRRRSGHRPEPVRLYRRRHACVRGGRRQCMPCGRQQGDGGLGAGECRSQRPCGQAGSWIVDDCAKFVAREIRRGVRYDGIIMDPPSYGRGPGGEVWKLEDSIYDFIDLCAGVLSGEPLFVAVNSYTTGLSPSVMEYMLRARVWSQVGRAHSLRRDRLPVTATGGVVPCGATAWWLARNAGL